MRKIIILILFFLFVGSCAAAYAHPPSDIIISYDAGSHTLKAIIAHPVSNPKGHYIKKVDIALNGKEICELKFVQQDNNKTQTITYVISGVRPKDRLSVEAYCSISGKLKKEIEVK